MSDMELKPCPFCGNNGEHERLSILSGICVGGERTAVHCGACFAQGPSVHDTHTNREAEAAKEWNTRPAAQSESGWDFDMGKAPRDKELLVAGKFGLSVCREYNLFEQWAMKDWENTPVIEPYAWIEVAAPSPKEQG